MSSPRYRKMDPETQTEICSALMLGCSRRNAARLAGVSCQAIRYWEQKDPLFAERLLKAQYHREIGPLRKIYAAGEKSWRAAKWILERLIPNEYGARKPHTVTPDQITEVMQ